MLLMILGTLSLALAYLLTAPPRYTVLQLIVDAHKQHLVEQQQSPSASELPVDLSGDRQPSRDFAIG